MGLFAARFVRGQYRQRRGVAGGKQSPGSGRGHRSRGGRPDLAWNDLPLVRAPTLLIVGSEDTPVVEWNQQAYQQLTCPKELVVIPGAGHLFEEPGALEQVADHARRWFERYLTQPAPPNPEPHPPQTKNWL